MHNRFLMKKRKNQRADIEIIIYLLYELNFEHKNRELFLCRNKSAM